VPTDAAAVRELLAGVPGLDLRAGEPLARHTTLRIGGPAELWAEVGTERALVALLRACGAGGTPFHLLGLGSNVLIPDEGIPGVVACLVGGLERCRIRGTRVSAGGGAVLAQVARKTAQAGLAGLEALAGFPSTVGGGVYMNAGSYGTEIKDVLVSARVVERDGTRRRLTVAELEPRYRWTNLERSRAVVVRAHFDLRPGDPAALMGRIRELNAKRWAALPSGVPSAGSIFKNPPGDFAGRLIEACGLKGAAAGGARISERHANVIVNTGGARAADVVVLMRRMRGAVAERFGVELEPEVVLAGGLRSALDAGRDGSGPPRGSGGA
jgi:UDP-N-acetylmuramate dehydrogenase